MFSARAECHRSRIRCGHGGGPKNTASCLRSLLQHQFTVDSSLYGTGRRAADGKGRGGARSPNRFACIPTSEISKTLPFLSGKLPADWFYTLARLSVIWRENKPYRYCKTLQPFIQGRSAPAWGRSGKR